MGLSRTTPPQREPLEIDDVKTHLRVDGDDENALIEFLIAGAREYAEKFTRRSFLTQTWTLTLDEFPGRHFFPWFVDGGFNRRLEYKRHHEANVIRLEYCPVQTISFIKYYDPFGNLVTMDPTAFQFANNTEIEPRIVPAPLTTWSPTQTGRLEAVQIQYVAGYGDTPDTVPQPLKNAMLLHIGTAYQNRESSIVGPNSADLPSDNRVDQMLGIYRAFSFS